MRVRRMLEARNLVPRSPETIPALLKHLELEPSTNAARRDYIGNKLRVLDDVICAKGSEEFTIRGYVRREADAVRISLEAEGLRNSQDRLYHTRALELVRDAGTENPTRANVERLIEYSWSISDFYQSIDDYLNFGKSLQILANGYRTIGQETLAKQLTGHAWNILSERYSRSRNPDVITIVHKSALWNLRLRTCDTDPKRTVRKIGQIRGFANEVYTPAIRIETHRELIGHFGKRFPEGHEASKEREHLAELRGVVCDLPPYGIPTFLRPEIETALSSERKSDNEQGVHCIKTDYLRAYSADPNLAFCRVLQNWNRTYRLGLQIDEPQYCSIMMVYMPRAVPKQ